MKLRLISEIQYKETSTNINRAQSPNSLSMSSINDLYHRQPKKEPKTKKAKLNAPA